MMDQWRRKLLKSGWTSRGRLDCAEKKVAVAVVALWQPCPGPMGQNFMFKGLQATCTTYRVTPYQLSVLDSLGAGPAPFRITEIYA